ncbi:MAG: hypothetical protein A3I61_03495 [Acidobacteria bacterium RIFCSPLOWO2_02_FULL_68_18]|nr:MAG: hypothetical protein A3I61_03495 [Acidobacteria bacterium RIFCSPLOWO2_02_FULL_68_18]OFW48177.1 MAG: hypothetical protein A3G77_04925 [Acidobacteria bacterium RIFCSPLOWO2_12_FULL_68_19]
MSLWPKEHGAYGQLAFPLVTSLAVAGLSASALLLALSAVAAFLAHEPLLVLRGGRGGRARLEAGRRAAVWLAVTGGLALLGGAAGLWLMPEGTRWSLLLPLVPAASFAAALLRTDAKSAQGEVAVALSFSLLAVPLGLAAGAPLREALAVAVAYAAIFVTATLAVRVVILKVRGGGSPGAVRATRAAALVLAAAGGAGITAAATSLVLPWTTVVAAAPGLIAATVLALGTPSPARLRAVGWTLIGISAAAALVLVIGLRSR